MKKKILVTTGLLSVIWALSVAALYLAWFIGINTVEANPDFVCVKSVTHGTCDHITSCDPWDLKTHTRTCYGYNVTKTAYYHTRTSCEPWYSVEKRWTTSESASAANYIKAKDASALYSDRNRWASWRHSRDIARSTESCTITQVDTKTPVWSEQKEYR